VKMNKTEEINLILWQLFARYLQAPNGEDEPGDDLGEGRVTGCWKDCFEVAFEDGSTFVVKVTKRRR
jgi:hypothetical protein